MRKMGSPFSIPISYWKQNQWNYISTRHTHFTARSLSLFSLYFFPPGTDHKDEFICGFEAPKHSSGSHPKSFQIKQPTHQQYHDRPWLFHLQREPKEFLGQYTWSLKCLAVDHAGFEGGIPYPLWLWVDTKSRVRGQQTSPWWWHSPARTWARHTGFLTGPGASPVQMSWARSNPSTAALQQHTACNAVETIPNLKAVENVKEKEEWGPNQEAAPTFLPVHPHKLFINIPKYTYQWRIHGDSLNTKLLSIMTRRTCLTPSSSSTPCPGWITHKAPLVFYSSKVLPEPLPHQWVQTISKQSSSHKCCIFKSIPISFSKFLFEPLQLPQDSTDSLHFLDDASTLFCTASKQAPNISRQKVATKKPWKLGVLP